MRYVISVLCIIVIVLHALFPQFQIDQISFLFFILAVALLILPEFSTILRQAKKFKTGPFEMEFDRSLDELIKQTEAAEKEIAETPHIIGDQIRTYPQIKYTFFQIFAMFSA